MAGKLPPVDMSDTEALRRFLIEIAQSSNVDKLPNDATSQDIINKINELIDLFNK